MLLALSRKNYIFNLLHLEVDLLTLKMTLNHENNIRDEFFSQNYTKKMYYTCSYCKLLKNYILPLN